MNTLIHGKDERRKSLSTKEKLFSRLNNYKHMQRVWNAFNMKEKEDYVYLYNMQEVSISLVVDIDFMENVSAKFNLILSNFVMFALFSWECALKIKK